MKVKELGNLGPLESRIQRCLVRLMLFGVPGCTGFYYRNKSSLEELCCEFDELELKDILDMYSEGEIMKTRGFGAKSMKRLKELAY